MTDKRNALNLGETMDQPHVGMRVIANGYPGTIARVCEWSDSMVEVRLASGLVCVDFNGTDCYPAPSSDVDGGHKVRGGR
jgi:hypothetical protein